MKNLVIIPIITIIVVIGLLPSMCKPKEIDKKENASLTESIVEEQTSKEIVDNSIGKIIESEVPIIQEEIIEKNTEEIQEEMEEEIKNESNNSVYTPIKEEQTTYIEVQKENIEENQEIIPQNNTPIIEEETQNIPISEPEVIAEEPKYIGEEYKQNDAMINTIKSVIDCNKSDDMIQYGYEIVIDSSIVDLTSQFTYSEKRVISKIKYKFGTIRIYARDYYNNGEYVCTQCYII